MKRILALLCLCLTAVLLFCSCGGAALFDKKEIAQNDTHNTYDVTEVKALAGYQNITGNNGYNTGYGVFSKIDATNITYKVFSFVTGSIVCEITQKTSDLEPEFGFDGETGLCYIANTNADGVVVGYTIYGKDGTVIAKGKSDIAPAFAKDRVLYDNKIYQVKDGALVEKAKVVDWNTALRGTLPSITDYADGVYANIGTDSVVFYDEKFDVTGIYLMPESSFNPDVTMLANGNVFVQYMVPLPLDAKNYDFSTNMAKFDLVQEVVKPNGNVSKVNLDGVVTEIVRLDTDAYPLIDAENAVALCPIKDKLLLSDDNAEIYELKNNGRLGTEFPKFDGVYAIDFTALGNGYLLAETGYTERMLLLDKNLKVIGDVSGCSDFTDRYIVGIDGIYDYEMNRLLTFKKTDGKYSYVTTCGSNIILKFTDNETGDASAYIFDGRETKLTSNYTRYQPLSDKLYTVLPIDTIDNTVTVYAPNGTVLAGDIMNPKIQSNRQNDNLFLYGTNASVETVYYYLTAK